MNHLYNTAAWQRTMNCLLTVTLMIVTTALYAQDSYAQDRYSKEMVAIKDAWVRPSAPGQDVGAAYMTLLSTQNASLIHVESDITKS